MTTAGGVAGAAGDGGGVARAAGDASSARPPHAAAASDATAAMILTGQLFTGEGRTPKRAMLRCESLTQTYVSGGHELTVLHDITFELPAGGFLALVGPSGSGKTTLLGLLAGLDRPRAGRVWLDGTELGALDEDQRARLRAEKVGFVFQSFHLLPSLTALENVQVPLELLGRPARESAREMLARVGLAERGHHYPAQLSGGEQQRVALARAFVHRPRVLFADEPTGSLDAENGRHVMELMSELNRELGTTLALATHDAVLAARAQRVMVLSQGRVASDRPASRLVEPEPVVMRR
jgi:putative ABC transport system ATP-binding protein